MPDRIGPSGGWDRPGAEGHRRISFGAVIEDRGEHRTHPVAEEEIHLPTPTIAPPTVALGVMLLAFGVAGISSRAPGGLRDMSPILLVAGAVFLVLGIAVWLVNDAREFGRTGDHGEHGGH